LIEALEIMTGTEPERAIIWLHGLGADGHDFEPLVPELRLPYAARFIFPQAPMRRITINNGPSMRAWYDLTSLGPGPEDTAGIRASAALVGGLIDREIERGIPPERIVLAGFSQGGAIALYAGLREPRRLAGILALSTYLPLASSLAAEKAAANADVSIWMAHGSHDPVIPISYAEYSRDVLARQGYRVDWHVYTMAHAVCPAEIADISAWLNT
jgi:phospholipase/carboxylesterase